MYLRSSLVGSAIGLSTTELRRTSLSDKQWLGISEEQLINEIFTDEFYRRLRNPDEIWFAQEDIGNSETFSRPRKAPSNAPLDDIFLPYILPLYPPIPNIITSLLQDLLKVI